ncbi:MAG: PilN domain-containing protein [Nitrospinae bacterium]|nr:PilN domain-containing protein [Nitrospinota bacterium]
MDSRAGATDSQRLRMRINLLVVRVPKDKALVQKQAIAFVLALAGTLVALGFWTNLVFSAKASAEESLAKGKTRLEQLDSVQKKIDEFEAKKKRREQILEAIKKLEERKAGPGPYLDALNLVLPPDIWLTELSAQGSALTLSGNSFTNAAIAEMMRSMEANDQFKDVELSIIQNDVVQKENIKRFTLSSALKAVAKLDEKKTADKAKQGAPAPAPAPQAK